jgi:hypothetical protein
MPIARVRDGGKVWWGVWLPCPPCTLDACFPAQADAGHGGTEWECALHEGNMQCGRDRDSGLWALANEMWRCTATPSLDITWLSPQSRMLEAKYTRACGNC